MEGAVDSWVRTKVRMVAMTIQDISMPLCRETPVFPGDPQVLVLPFSEVVRDGYAMKVVILGTHSGTHIDAPRHLFEEGAGVDSFDWSVLCGAATVLEISNERAAGPPSESPSSRGGIDAGDLIEAARGVELAPRILIRTPPSRQPSHLTRDAAEWLRDQGACLVGIDSLSVDCYPHAVAADPFPVHHVLLGAPSPIVILEGVVLDAVATGSYDLLCVPLRLVDCDGSPVRALLLPAGTLGSAFHKA